MEYDEAINYLVNLQETRPKFGTETTAEMLHALEDPHAGIRCIQIAGSNGKGSTACMLDRILRSAGLDVGLYTSPDLNDIRERIQINGRNISKQELTSLVAHICPHVAERAAEGDAPTQFEVLTALGLACFDQRDVDIAILEVGIGGRYDATSVVDPVASAVTSVSLEHTNLLGDTVEEIARDKAQVTPATRPLVTGATGDSLSAILEEADVVTVGEKADADVVVQANGLRSHTEQAVVLDGDGWRVETRLSLLGRHQAVNAGIAATLARQVTDVDERTLEQGLRKANWPGRFEIVATDPHVVLDGAHNPDACSKLAALVERYNYENLHLIFGALRDKNHEEMIDNLPVPDTVTLCRPDVDRAANPETLERIITSKTDSPVETVPAVLDAVEQTIHRVGPNDMVVVTGSLYTVSEARDRWTRRPIPKQLSGTTSIYELLPGSTHAQKLPSNISGETIKTYCRPARARYLKDLMLSVGGTAAVSDIDGVHQHIDVVLNGSHNEFDRLITILEGTNGELSHIAMQLRSVVDKRDAMNGLPWDETQMVMGILNVTPDSFHDGGEYTRVEDAVARAEQLVANGADIIDIGGESTRPGAAPVSVEEEIERVIPVIERLADRDVPVTVDTLKPPVAKAAIEAGADAINDVSGLEDPEMRRVIGAYDVPVILMHSIDTPVNPDRSVTYDDVVEDVIEELTERIILAERAGIDRSQIIVDPGTGFGKRPAENFELIARLDELRALGCPILLGHSHKSLFTHVSCGPDDRLAPTVATTALAAERGADIIRVHDVTENAAAMRVAQTMNDQR